MTGSLLTAAEVAELLGVPKSWVYEQSRAGRIPTVTLGHPVDGRKWSRHTRRTTRSAIWMAELTVTRGRP